MKNLKTKNNKKVFSKSFQMLLLLSLTLVFATSCAKKSNSARTEPAAVAANGRTNTGATSGNASVVPTASQSAAQAEALNNGVDIKWVSSDYPTVETTNSNQKYFYVVNVFSINGKSYELPTIHYDEGVLPVVAKTGYFTLDGVDYDVDAQCVDWSCSKYYLSVKVSKNSQNLKQQMLYVDYLNKNNPIIGINDKNHFMSFADFTNTIKSYIQ